MKITIIINRPSASRLSGQLLNCSPLDPVTITNNNNYNNDNDNGNDSDSNYKQ